MGETRHWEREALLKPAQCPSASHPACPALQGPHKPGSPQHPSKAPGGHHGASGSPLEVPRASGDLVSARRGFSPGQSHQPSPSGQVSHTPSTEGGAPPPDIGFPLVPRIPGWKTIKNHFCGFHSHPHPVFYQSATITSQTNSSLALGLKLKQLFLLDTCQASSARTAFLQHNFLLIRC